MTDYKELLKGDISCLVIKDNEIVYKAKGKGIAPLLELFDNNVKLLNDAYVIDKIIGKAAAIILLLSKVKRVYGVIMSESAYDLLRKNNIEVEYGEKVEMIINRNNDGMCPMEKAVINITDLNEGYNKLKETIKILKSGDAI
jgi:hypothetical protein